MAFDRRRFLPLLALAVAGVSGPAWARQQDDLPFRVDLPPGFTVKARPRGPDFDVYDVMKGEVGYVGVYVGNFPSFPMSGAKARPSGSSKGQVAEVRRADGSLRRDYLIVAPSGYPKLHVWTQEPVGDLATADKIAASVKAK